MKPAAFLLVFILLAASAPVASADIYKCPKPDGKVEYSDRPCEGALGQKVKPAANSVGTGSDLATIRAQDAEFRARQDAKQKAIDKANRENYIAAERAFYEERKHQDSQDLVNAIREGNNQRAADAYNSRYIPPIPLSQQKPRAKK